MRELRFFNSELRSTGGRKIAGYAARFNEFSQDLGGFREQISPGAFQRSLRSRDVVALFNHKPDAVLGRTSSGTLELHEDSQGLYFEVSVPDTSVGRDVLELVRRRDLNGASFGFIAKRDAWNRAGNERTLQDVDLLDVSPVTFPAYPTTSVSARSQFKDWDRVGVYSLTRKSNARLYTPVNEMDLEIETIRARQELALMRMEVEE